MIHPHAVRQIGGKERRRRKTSKVVCSNFRGNHINVVIAMTPVRRRFCLIGEAIVAY